LTPGASAPLPVPVPRGAPTSSRAPLPPGFTTIWATVALDLVGFGIVLPLLPLYASDRRFGASPAVVGALLASFSLAQFVFAPVWGRLSDRVGRKPVLVLSLAGTAVGSLLTGLAGSLVVLFVGRVIDGVSGASVSVAQAAVADLATPEQRPRLFGLLGAAFGLGFVAGPAIGSLAALGDRRLPFLIAAAIAAVNAVIAVRRLPETNPRHLRGTVAEEAGWVRETGLEDEAAALMPRPLSRTAAPPTRPAREMTRLLLVAFVSLAAFSAFEATFTLFGRERLHLQLASAGAVFVGIGVVLALVQASLVHPVVERLGERGTLRAGLLANAGGLLLLAAVHSWLLLVPALLALVVGQGLVMPSLTASFAGRAGRERRGRVLGVQQSANGLARVVGPVFGGLAFERLGAPSPFLAGAAVMALCVAMIGRNP
jgi:DHA1 family tetracycline resistance protein-like MFS transporter